MLSNSALPLLAKMATDSSFKALAAVRIVPTVQQFSTTKAPPDGSNITKEQIETILKQHEVKGVSMPVRAEFIRPHKPLNTDDLQAIDIHVYHKKPECISDHVAYRTVRFMRFFADAFFRKRYVHRAIVLETVAGVPGMVAGMTCHLKSLRRMQNDNGWIEKLLHEAENERMHLMIWMRVTNPTKLERLIVTLAQGVFFNVYALFYLLFPRTAHRLVGYLEEEAIISYNAFAKEVHLVQLMSAKKCPTTPSGDESRTSWGGTERLVSLDGGRTDASAFGGGWVRSSADSEGKCTWGGGGWRMGQVCWGGGGRGTGLGGGRRSWGGAI